MNSFLPLLYLTGKPFSAVTKIFFTCLLQLIPSDGFAATLAEPYEAIGQVCVHRLEYLILVSFARFFTQWQLYLFHYGQISFLPPFKNDRQVFTAVEKSNSPVPSFLSGGQNRNDDRRKNII